MSFTRTVTVLLVTVLALSCHPDETPVGSVLRANPHATRYFTVREQVRIAEVARQLWTGACMHQGWEEAARRILDACGSSFRYDEAHLLASYHPRALSEPAWRADFERALRAQARPSWHPSPEPLCRTIQEVIAPPARPQALPPASRAEYVTSRAPDPASAIELPKNLASQR